MRRMNIKILKKHIDALGNKGVEKFIIKTDLSRSSVEKLISGSMCNPTLETITKLCLATGFEFEELFPFVDSEEKAA